MNDDEQIDGICDRFADAIEGTTDQDLVGLFQGFLRQSPPGREAEVCGLLASAAASRDVWIDRLLCDSLWVHRKVVCEALTGTLFRDEPSKARQLGLHQLGHFQPFAVIGFGGTGTVFKARGIDRSIVAVKVAHPSNEHAAEALAQEHEALVLAQDGVAQVPRVQGASAHAESVNFLALEFIEGCPLDEWLERHANKHFESVLELARQLVSAVNGLHQARLCHGDLTPANILVTGQPEGPELRLVDFGSANRGYHVGRNIHYTAHFSAPELLAGKVTQTTGATDLWSLGVILSLMFSGRHPFGDELDTLGHEDLRKCFENGPHPAEPPQLSQFSGVWGLIQACMSRDPQQRRRQVSLVTLEAAIPTAQQYAATIASKQSDLASRRDEAERAILRRRWSLRAMVVALLAVTGLVLYFRGSLSSLHTTSNQILAAQKADKAEINAAIERIAAQLVAKVPEDQQIDSLRVQLEAALRRLADAEAAGDPSAKAKLNLLRTGGDPRLLGQFLDEQIARDHPPAVGLLRERAAVAYVTGDIDRAEQCLNDILDQLPNDLDAINRLGRIYKLRGDFTAAERQYNLMLELAPQDEAIQAVAYCNLGNVVQERGDFERAEEMYNKALAIEEKFGRLEGMADSYSNLGVVMRIRGNLAGAEAMHNKSRAINEKLARLDGMARDYANLAVLLRIRGDPVGAQAMHKKALGIYETLGNLELMATQYGALGILTKATGDLRGAKALFEKALEINEKIGKLEGVADVCGDIANLLLSYDLAGAEAMYNKSLAINERLGRRVKVAIQYGNLGILLHLRGDLNGAEEMHNKALTIDEELGRLDGMASNYGNLGVIARLRGDLQGAEAMHKKALAIFKGLGDLENIATQNANLGTIAEKRKDFVEARRLWSLSRDQFAKLGSKPKEKAMQDMLDTLPPP
ncbi:serine/threonine-protein kinase [Humisphaera borealis]|uniref:Tetratricopeptide repeat protein n=1 Tax=Humisphaera borealis TaxID=2807512 RepID=A0A7M2X2V8_9BACT|nr:serine/threonine-protein kinase [Humisphaera borealis]QOV92088.1 tetratricopeptide repeat protein [Humisphaera borealis]